MQLEKMKAHLNVPNAAIEGHIIKVDDDNGRPVASLWIGGGTHGVETQVAYAGLLAASTDMFIACEAMIHAAKMDDPAAGAIAATLAETAVAKATFDGTIKLVIQ